jgi:WD40 repeat protein/tRNA A-37 threonylcarbamoyl transferase component Bud32
MTERTIFLRALEHEDAAARAAFLDKACAGKPGLRQRIELLLQSHQQADNFLEVPAVEQLAGDDQVLACLTPTPERGELGRLDHYEVLQVVGRGATGLVLKARDTKLQRVVAIKVLAPRLAASDPARRRFVREAQAAAAVRDDHVVGIHAVHDDGPLPYLVMEYIAGITLQDRIKQGGAPELPEVLRIGLQVARGLAAAHAQGLIHRDIKPGNILLENGVQRVKITDFGLALAATDACPSDQGVLAGTPLYMSPEQARAEPTDCRSDLFSLGSVLYAFCTGHPPFQADSTVGVLQSVREDNPRPIHEINPDVPEWLCDLIAKLQAKKPGDRFASAEEVADLLGRHLALVQQALPVPPAAEPVQSPQSGQAEPQPAAVPRHRRLTLAAVCLVVVILALAALAAFAKLWGFQGTHRVPCETASVQISALPGPLELQRDDIPPHLLALAGGGDPAKAPRELAAVLGDGRFLLPGVGQTAWMEQSPDGKLLAVPLDEDVVLIEAPTGTHRRTLRGPGGRVYSVTFSPDSSLLAASTRFEAVGGSVRVWDLRADRVLYTKPQPGPVISGAVIFSPDGRRLVTEDGGRLHVWDAHSGRGVQILDQDPQGIASIGFSPDGRRLAVANWYGNQVRVFDCAGNKLVETSTRQSHPWPTTSAVYSPDGKFLASADLTGFKLWNAQTLEQVWAVQAQAQQLAFAPDSRTLFGATTTEEHRAVHTFSRWDVVTQKELPPLSVEVSVNPVRAFHCLGRDGKVLFVVTQHDATYVKAIDTATGKELFPHQGHVAPLNVVALSSDGRTIATAGEDWVVKLWDLASGQVRHSLTAHTGSVCGLAFSPDGKLLASGSRDGTIAVWIVDSGTEVRALHGHSRMLSQIQFSPDGRTLAAGGEKGTVKLWDVASGKEVSPLQGHTGAARCVAFDPDATFLASGGDDKSVHLHNLAAGSSRKLAVPGAVNALAFSPDGRTLAAVTDAPAATVRLWDLQSGRETSWQGHTGHVLGLAFCPSAPLLATCAEDGTVRLWNLTGGDPGARIIGPGPFGGPVRAVAFTPDGRYLATANANGTVYLLRLGTFLRGTK